MLQLTKLLKLIKKNTIANIQQNSQANEAVYTDKEKQ